MYFCSSVIVFVVAIVNDGRSIWFFVFLHQIDWVDMVLIILNLEGLQNCMTCSKIKTCLTKFLLMIDKGFFGSETILLWILGESAGEGLLLLALVKGGR